VTIAPALAIHPTNAEELRVMTEQIVNGVTKGKNYSYPLWKWAQIIAAIAPQPKPDAASALAHPMIEAISNKIDSKAPDWFLAQASGEVAPQLPQSRQLSSLPRSLRLSSNHSR
jgi:hypothetical protein